MRVPAPTRIYFKNPSYLLVRTARGNSMKNPVMHDFIVTLYVFNNVISSKKIKEITLTELKNLIDNIMPRNKDFFV